MEESEYIVRTVQTAKETLLFLPREFQRLKKESEKKIDYLCEQAGILGDIQAIKDELEKSRLKIQSQVDVLQGQISVLESIYAKYHVAPIPQGVTHMYGIPLQDLDPRVRLKVMKGFGDPDWESVIRSLGGDPSMVINDWAGKPKDRITSTPVEEDIEPSVYDLMDASPSSAGEEDIEDDEEIEEEFEEDESDDDEEYQRVMAEELREFEQRVEEGTATPEDIEAIKALSALARSRR